LREYVDFLEEEREQSPLASQPFTISTNFPARVGTNDGLADLSDHDRSTSALKKLGEAGADQVIVVVPSHDPDELTEAVNHLGLIQDGHQD
jgi:hypothetical protein